MLAAARTSGGPGGGRSMFEEFHRQTRTKIVLDRDLLPRDLRHDSHVKSRAGTVQLAAQDYLRKFYKLIRAKTKELTNLSLPPTDEPIDAGIEYRFLAEKPQFDTTTISYCQTFFGLPVWEAGVAVHMKQQPPFSILGAQLTRHWAIEATKPSAKALARLQKLNEKKLAKLLGIAGKRTAFDVKSLEIHNQRLMVYRFEKSRRGIPEPGKGKPRRKLASQHPTLPLPPLPHDIEEDRHYVVAAVDFRLD